MKKMNSYYFTYFFTRGQFDEVNHIRLKNREVIDLYSIYYKFGILSERFKNSPKRKMFLDELIQAFDKLDTLPASIVVIPRFDNLSDHDISEIRTFLSEEYILLQHKYSHKIMRRIFSELGYTISDVTFETVTQKVGLFQKEKINKWSNFTVSRIKVN